MKFRDQLKAMGACSEAVAWVDNRTLEQAWAECERSQWMLWLLRKSRIDTSECEGHFALRVWHLVPEDAQLACAWAIDCALRGADEDEIDAASYSAYAACAAYAAYAYAANGDAATYAAAAAERRAQCDIIRDLIPLAKVRRALAGRNG